MTRPHCSGSLVLVVWCLTLGSTAVATAQDAAWTHPMLAHGAQPNHGYFSAAPWERVDMASGNLMLTIPGLTLVGANGMDFQFTAVANSVSENGNITWAFGVPGPAIIVFGYGFSNNPVVGTLDGGRQVAYAAGPNRYRTQSADLLEINNGDNNATLRQPNGVVSTFYRYTSFTCTSASGGSYNCGTYLITHTSDPFGNGLDYTRTDGGTLIGVVQRVGGQTRTITVTYETDALVVSWPGEGDDVPPRTWRYEFHPTMGWLTDIVPAVGPGWHFDYTTPHAVTVTTPSGGTVTYQMQLQFGEFRPRYHTYRLKSRAVAGVEGVWDFFFHDDGTGNIDSRVTLPPTSPPYEGPPVSIVRAYQHARIGGGLYAERQVLASVTVNAAPPYAEVVAYTWSPSQYPVGTAVPVRPDLNDEDTWYEEDGAPLLLGEVATVRDGALFTTTYAYCGESGQPGCSNVGDPLCTSNVLDYGQPTTVRETSSVTPAAWVTAYTYRDDFGSLYLRGRVATQTLTSGAESYHRTAAYDDFGFRLSETVLETTTSFTRDGYGQVQSLTDANGHPTSFTSAWGAVENTQTPKFLITRTIRSDGLAWAVTQNGATTGFEYDALGRQTHVDPPIGNDSWTEYAADGTSVKVSRGTSWTQTTLDGFGRAVSTENSQGVLTATQYDPLGRTRKMRSPYDAAHTVPAWTTFDYDALDRVTKKTNPGGSFVQYLYTSGSVEGVTGLRTTIIDENLNTTTQLWQAVGAPGQAWLRAVTDADEHTTWYEYNALGSLTKVTSPDGVTRTWSYDTRNRLEWQEQPESGRTSYLEYDGVGNLRKQRDANLHDTLYEYDDNNRLTAVTSPDPMYSTAIEYDDANNRRSVSNGYVSTTFEYDAANRLTRRTDVVRTTGAGPGRTFVSAFTPDGNGNVIDVHYPSTNHVQYGYDSENRVISVSDSGRNLTFATTFSYHPAGGLTGYTSGDGAVHIIEYNERQWPRDIGATGLVGLPALTYHYDGVGNVESIGDAREGHGATFTYDALDRLKTASGVWGSMEYWYDSLGNRERKTHGTATTWYHYPSQRLTSTSGAEVASFGFDDNGNVTSDPVAAYTYTPTNMLETASLVAGALYTYRYDGDNQRALKRQGANTTTYYLRGLGQVLSEFEEESGVATWTVDYVYLGARLLAGIRPPASTGLTLTVGKTGVGTGTVTSVPAGLTCGASCSATFAAGTLVSLIGVPDPATNSILAGWTGDPDCADGVVTLTAAKTCVAVFAPFTKRTPAAGTAGLTAPVTLTWSPIPGATYEVCVDWTDDHACAGAWRFAGESAQLSVEGVAPGMTYFWQVRRADQPSIVADFGTWSSFTVAQPAPRRHWYLAEGTTVWAFGFQEDLVVFNPSVAATHVDIRYLKPNGTVVLQDFDLGAKTRRAVRVNTVVQGTDVAAVVDSSTEDVVVERTMTWSSGRGGHHGTAATAPAVDWYLAEGTSYGDFATYVTIANPGAAATTVEVTFTPDTGAAVMQTYAVGAQSRLTIYANGVIGAARNFWTRVHALGAPVVVERSMYWGSNFEGGHSTAASPAPAPEWRFAEGATGTGFGFSTYLLIANPDATATAAVQVRFVKGDGTAVTQSYQIQPLKRQTILANDIPGLGWAPGFSTIVRSVNGVGVVAERVMYWGNWVEGHATVGAPARSVAWWCGEGRQGTQDGLTYETYFPLLNEDLEQALTVRAEFALETGTTIVRTYTVQPGRRFTIWTGDVAELVGQKFAVTLEGTTTDGVTPLAFVAERATYWGDGWYGGHGSLGVARR